MIDLSCPARNDFSANLKVGFSVSGTVTVTKRSAGIQIPNTGFQVTIEPDKSSVQEIVLLAKRAVGDTLLEVTDGEGGLASFPRTAT